MGATLISASGWLSGHGVPVYSNAGNFNGPYQCVELIQRLISARGWGSNFRGNANQYMVNAPAADWDKHYSGYIPVQGDVIVWGGGSGGFGHVAVVERVEGNRVEVIEQNSSAAGRRWLSMDGQGRVKSANTKGYYAGTLHAKRNSPAPQPTTPTPPTRVEPPAAVTPPGTVVPPTTTAPPVTQPAPTAPRTYAAQQGSRGVNTFTNPYNASGMGPRVAPAQWVQISCKVFAPQIASANPDGYWYRIASAPWNNAYYSPANTFMNGDPWGGPYSRNTDWSIPNC